jgi:hypothetical protein
MEVNDSLLILSGQITPGMLTFNHVTLFPFVTTRLFHCPVDGQLLEHIHWQHCEWVSFEQPLRVSVACEIFYLQDFLVVWGTEGSLLSAD